MTMLATEEICRFGLVPKVALVSHSSFGTSDAPSAVKMRTALEMIRKAMPGLEVEGEMHGDAAISEAVRQVAFPNSRMKGDANLLIMPSLDAANISFNLLKVVGGAGITVGPILLGAAKPVHILTPTATVRRIINMTALAAVDAQVQSA
jgi:malate dehydrogenase (oxaloacetate-decarboxylating)(NADP+)